MVQEKIIYGVKVRLKSESKLMRFIGRIAKPFSPSFMQTYWTTLFTIVYAPSSFDINDEKSYHLHRTTLKHEAVHVADFKKYHIWFILTYLFPPTLFAYGRFYWERKAYLLELNDLIENHKYTTFYARLDQISNSLGGSNYFWAWPKSKIKKWFLMETKMF